jgi:hypothetical protein
MIRRAHVRVSASTLKELLAAARHHQDSLRDDKRELPEDSEEREEMLSRTRHAMAATSAVESAVKRITDGRGEEFLDFLIRMDQWGRRQRAKLGGGTGRGALLKAEQLNE